MSGSRGRRAELALAVVAAMAGCAAGRSVGAARVVCPMASAGAVLGALAAPAAGLVAWGAAGETGSGVPGAVVGVAVFSALVGAGIGIASSDCYVAGSTGARAPAARACFSDRNCPEGGRCDPTLHACVP